MAGAARAERELRPGSEAWRRTTEVRTRTHSNPNPNPNSDTNPNLNPSQSPNPIPSPNPIQVRIRTVLDAALAHGHTALVLGAFGPTLSLSLTLTLSLILTLTNPNPNQVLGAFGCGAFGNPPADVARLFAEVLASDEFRGALELVVFAIVDPKQADRGNIPTFRRALRVLCGE